jgi:hypothetical protein
MAAQLLVYDPMQAPGGKLTPQIQNVFRIDEQGALMIGNLSGRFREQTHRQHNFGAVTLGIGGLAISVGLATAYTGLYLYNPVGSNYVANILCVATAAYVAQVAVAAITLGAMGGAKTIVETTPITPFNCSMGGSALSQMHCGSSATITTPITQRPLVGGQVGSAFHIVSGPQFIDGEFEVLPGNVAMILAQTAVTGFWGIYWTEIPQ